MKKKFFLKEKFNETCEKKICVDWVEKWDFSRAFDWAHNLANSVHRSSLILPPQKKHPCALRRKMCTNCIWKTMQEGVNDLYAVWFLHYSIVGKGFRIVYQHHKFPLNLKFTTQTPPKRHFNQIFIPPKAIN